MYRQQPPVGRFLFLQLAVLVLVSGGCLFESVVGGRSALLGGLAHFIPNSLFTLRYFRSRGAHQAGNIFLALMLGEMFKLTMTALLFAGILLLTPVVSGPALFTGFGAMILSHLLTPFMFRRVVHR